MKISDLQTFLQTFAPPALSEPWDNTGLLLGDPERELRRVMTCLTITPATVREAVAGRVEMIVSHHPMPFHALKRITAETTVGRMLRELIRADIAVYSPHTSYDSAAGGINRQIAEGLGLTEIVPLVLWQPGTERQRSDRIEVETGSEVLSGHFTSLRSRLP